MKAPAWLDYALYFALGALGVAVSEPAFERARPYLAVLNAGLLALKAKRSMNGAPAGTQEKP